MSEDKGEGEGVQECFRERHRLTLAEDSGTLWSGEPSSPHPHLGCRVNGHTAHNRTEGEGNQ